MHGHVEQAALALGPDRGHAGHRRRAASLPFSTMRSRPAFSVSEHAAVGKKVDAPDHVEADHDRLELEGVQLALDDRSSTARPGKSGLLALELGGFLADEDDHRADFLLRQRVGHRRHARSEVALLDRLGDARVVAAELPHVVEQAGRLRAGQLGPVTARAQLAVQLRDVARVLASVGREAGAGREPTTARATSDGDGSEATVAGSRAALALVNLRYYRNAHRRYRLPVCDRALT